MRKLLICLLLLSSCSSFKFEQDQRRHATQAKYHPDSIVVKKDKWYAYPATIAGFGLSIFLFSKVNFKH